MNYFKGIDLSSDTATQPSAEMRAVIANAQVGDEQKREDPTTNELEEYVADLLGHDLAMYLPCASMSNEISLMLHCRPGDEIISSDSAHIIAAEVGGPAVHARAMCWGVATPTGIFTAQDIHDHIRMDIPHTPKARLVVIENTANLTGGIPWPLETLRDVQECARKYQMALHLDGARLMNASVASGLSPKELAQGFDTVTLCLSKGLGCPMGAVMVGKKEFLEPARRYKHLMGGALRQSGMMAAAGLYALKNNIERLQDDHDNAKHLAEGLMTVNGVVVDNQPIPSNMVFFHLEEGLSPNDFLPQLEPHGLRFSQIGPNCFRAVMHMDVGREDVEKAVGIVRSVSC
jgi:threonine aldolase